MESLEETEPQNYDLFLDISKLISRICSEDPGIIKMTQNILFKLKKNDPLNADYPLEIAT